MYKVSRKGLQPPLFSSWEKKKKNVNPLETLDNISMAMLFRNVLETNRIRNQNTETNAFFRRPTDLRFIMFVKLQYRVARITAV